MPDPAPTPSPTTVPAPSPQPAPAPAAGAPPPAGAPPSETDNVKQMREAYENLKKKHEPFEKLGDQKQVESYYAGYKGIVDEAYKLGEELGYSKEQVDESMAENPLGTLGYLRSKQAESSKAPQDVSELVKRAVEERTAPINEYLNQQLTDAAETRFQEEFNRLFSEKFKDTEAWPEEAKGLLYDIVSETLKYDEEGLKQLKMEKKTAAIQKYFEEGYNRLLKVYGALSGAEQKRATKGGGKVGEPSPTVKKPTIDELIEHPELINPKYKES